MKVGLIDIDKTKFPTLTLIFLIKSLRKDVNKMTIENIYEFKIANIDFEHNGCKFGIYITTGMKAIVYEYRDGEYVLCWKDVELYNNEDYEEIIQRFLVMKAVSEQYGLDN